jgi:hypothetical protein
MKKKILFLTYDGLTDPLGRSQIIPYLECISSKTRKVFVLSFEKSIKSKNVKIELKKKKISWVELKFTKKFGKIGKLYDLLKMLIFSFCIIYSNKIDVIHCRSHVPAFVGFILKKIIKVKLIFDFRGFWIEERFDYGLLNKSSFFDKFFFKNFKILEKKILKSSDCIICLTYKSKPVIKKIVNNKVPIEVMPCYADYNFFIKNKSNSASAKNKLNIKKKSIVLTYCGSINQIYLVKKMLIFFLYLKKKYSNLIFLFITPQINELKKIVRELPKNTFLNDIRIVTAEREEVPFYLSCANVSISFIKRKFSRIAMSPTKMFESFAMGLPFLCNNGIGDVSSIIKNYNSGGIININHKLKSKNNLIVFDKCLKIKNKKIIKNTFHIFDISIAKKKYDYIYNKF